MRSSKNIKFYVLILLAFALIGIANAEDNSTNISQNITQNTTILNASLQIWDSGETEVNTTVFFYANYTYDSAFIEDADCTIKIQDASRFMEPSPLIYYSNRSFAQEGNYTYQITCRKDDYSNETLEKAVQIISGNIDFDNDGYNNATDCNDNNPNISPGITEIFYNGIDDDCNADTLDSLSLTVTTDKASYNPGEIVYITVNAKNGSDTYLTINTPTNVSYIYIFDTGTYPVVQQYSLTTLSGNYSVDVVNYYQNYTLQKTVNYGIAGTFNAEIETDKNSAYEGELIHFKAVFTGAVGQVSMIWTMDNSEQRSSGEFDFNYTTMGSYNVILLATDQSGNQIIKTKNIIVNRRYFLQVTAVDNATGILLPNATIKLDSDSKEANSSGQAIFNVVNQTYRLRVSAENYTTYSEDIKLNNSLIFTVRLVKDIISTVPLVTLISPANNIEVSDLEFKYKFTDDTEAECKLYIAESEGWWQELSLETLQSDTEFAYKPDLTNGTYTWKVVCTDTDGNEDSSPEYTITYNPTVLIPNEEVDTTYNVIQSVYDLIPDFEKYSPDEQKIAEYLKLDIAIKDARRKLEMANRDLYNLRYEQTTDSVIQKRDEVYAIIDKIKDTTPQSISLKDKAEFVKYVDDSDVEELFSEYAKLKSLALKTNDAKKLIEQNKLLQKTATIQTTAYSVEIGFISGRTEDVTMVVREVETESSIDKVMLVEFIPKEIAESVSDIVFVEQPESILKEDPVFEYSLSKTSHIVYYLKNQIALENIPKIKPVLISVALSDNDNKVTGFSIFDTLGLSDSKRNIVILEVVVILGLLGVYVYYNYSSPKKDKTESAYFEQEAMPITETEPLYQPIIQADSEKLSAFGLDNTKNSYLKAIIQQAKEALSKNKLKDAAIKYHELKFIYELLDETSKKALFNEVISIADEIGIKHIEGLVEKAIVELATGNKIVAYNLYEEINEEFYKLSLDYQEKVYPRCCELAIHLKE